MQDIVEDQFKTTASEPIRIDSIELNRLIEWFFFWIRQLEKLELWIKMMLDLLARMVNTEFFEFKSFMLIYRNYFYDKMEFVLKNVIVDIIRELIRSFQTRGIFNSLFSFEKVSCWNRYSIEKSFFICGVNRWGLNFRPQWGHTNK